MRLFTTFGIVAALGLALGGCSSDSSGGGSGGTDSGTGGGGTGGGTGGTGGGTGGSAGSSTGGSAGTSGNDCSPCIATNCLTAISDCTADTDCAALLACNQTCDDSACVEACFAANPDGAQVFNDTVVACAEQNCATECEGAFPGG